MEHTMQICIVATLVAYWCIWVIGLTIMIIPPLRRWFIRKTYQIYFDLGVELFSIAEKSLNKKKSESDEESDEELYY